MKGCDCVGVVLLQEVGCVIMSCVWWNGIDDLVFVLVLPRGCVVHVLVVSCGLQWIRMVLLWAHPGPSLLVHCIPQCTLLALSDTPLLQTGLNNVRGWISCTSWMSFMVYVVICAPPP